MQVGIEEAKVSVMMVPDADQVKISIWPGVSRMIWLYARQEREFESVSHRKLQCRPDAEAGISDHSLYLVTSCIQNAEHLIELGCEQIQRRKDTSIGA